MRKFILVTLLPPVPDFTFLCLCFSYSSYDAIGQQASKDFSSYSAANNAAAAAAAAAAGKGGPNSGTGKGGVLLTI